MLSIISSMKCLMMAVICMSTVGQCYENDGKIPHITNLVLNEMKVRFRRANPDVNGQEDLSEELKDIIFEQDFVDRVYYSLPN